jgi:uncharacterized protein YcbX
MRLAAIHTYPVKGGRRVDRDAAVVEPWGLAGDRRWLVVDPDGTGLTQREERRLALLDPQPRDGGLVLRTAGRSDLAVPVPADGEPVPVTVHSAALTARPAGPAADDWVSALLGRPVRLVHLHDPRQRPLKPGRGAPTDRVSFADAYPLLLTNAASLDAVNDWLVDSGDEPVPMARFRPNLVVSGAPPWAEDGWVGGTVRVGGVAFRAGKLCDRCVVTTVDQDTGEQRRQPLSVLRKRRSSPDGPLFGLYLIPAEPLATVGGGDRVGLVAGGDRVGLVAVGDPVDAD